MDEDGRKRQAKLKPLLNIIEMNRRASEQANWAVRFLILFFQAQPEKEPTKVMNWPVARALTMSMLGDGSPWRSIRHHKIAQQMIFRPTGTLLEMLDETHREIVSKRLKEMQQDALGVSPSAGFTDPVTRERAIANDGYKHHRKEIEKDISRR